MTYENKNVFLTVKAYPEKSRKYGASVCTAGITETGEMVRLYPIPFETFRGGKNIHKYSWISVECQKASEYLNRKESYRVRYNTIKILSTVDTGPNRSWKKRNHIVLPTLSNSLEELDLEAQINNTSLGLIKPRLISDLTIDEKECINGQESQIIKEVQITLDGESRSSLEEIEYNFRYHFYCPNPECNGHNMMCEDWEMIESWRKWKQIYPNRDVLVEKFKNKFLNEMIKRDIYFFVGTHSRYNTWLIIGLYYPPLAE